MFEEAFETLNNMKPLTPQRIAEIRARVRESEEMKQIRKQVSDLKAIKAVFEK